MKRLIILFLALFSFVSLAQEYIKYNDPEVQEILKSDKATLCIYEFFKTNPKNIAVKKKTIEGDIVVSDYYQFKSDDYDQEITDKKYIEMVIRQDFLVNNDSLIYYNCTVNK